MPSNKPPCPTFLYSLCWAASRCRNQARYDYRNVQDSMGDRSGHNAAGTLPQASKKQAGAGARNSKSPSEREAGVEIVDRIEGVQETKQEGGNHQAHAELNSQEPKRSTERPVDSRLDVAPVKDLLAATSAKRQPR